MGEWHTNKVEFVLVIKKLERFVCGKHDSPIFPSKQTWVEKRERRNDLYNHIHKC